MNPFEMVVLIVLIVTAGHYLRVKAQHRGKQVSLAHDPEAIQLKEEVKRLRDRVAVLERIATDKNHLLEQEFERLRDS
jgi:hypothetical protein